MCHFHQEELKVQSDVFFLSHDFFFFFFLESEKMKSMSQLAVLTRRWSPSTMKLGPFEEVILENSSVDELKEKVCLCLFYIWLLKAI